MLKKGDKCYVRNFYGDIEECEYGYRNWAGHVVSDKSGGLIVAAKSKPIDPCYGRFVCMTGLNKGKYNA